MPKSAQTLTIDAVAIGRNEGARLQACLASLAGEVRRVVYVDSGSSDGSVEAALAMGAQVVALDMSLPFTAARARNAGLAALADNPPDFVQFIDGDCALREGWIARGRQFLHDNLGAAVVCGRRRERFPEASLYNAMIDAEWDTPVGKATSCGGDALMRYQAVSSVKGFREDLIAGEEPELCLRLRSHGWSIWRIDAEMTWHDAEMMRFGQWWRRAERAGHAFAEGAARFSTTRSPHWTREVRRIWIWGLALPLIALVGSLLHPAALLLLLAYPLQVLRLQGAMGWRGAFFNTLGKFPEAIGALRFYARRIGRGEARLIEYK
ncbi:glycosyltransferase family 2 protein [Pararhodobacter oceanensis]|uniref:glycosyltransferase family 2 protein n=1 Tax=Pararhodobacter oceanensis TaxID=2172121 RepID=UPI003A9032D1